MGTRADSGVAAVGDGEGSVCRQFFRECTVAETLSSSEPP